MVCVMPSATYSREPMSRKNDKRGEYSPPVLADGEMNGEWGQTPEPVVRLGEQCFSSKPRDRPSMANVVLCLERVFENETKCKKDPTYIQYM